MMTLYSYRLQERAQIFTMETAESIFTIKVTTLTSTLSTFFIYQTFHCLQDAYLDATSD